MQLLFLCLLTEAGRATAHGPQQNSPQCPGLPGQNGEGQHLPRRGETEAHEGPGTPSITQCPPLSILQEGPETGLASRERLAGSPMEQKRREMQSWSGRRGERAEDMPPRGQGPSPPGRPGPVECRPGVPAQGPAGHMIPLRTMSAGGPGLAGCASSQALTALEGADPSGPRPTESESPQAGSSVPGAQSPCSLHSRPPWRGGSGPGFPGLFIPGWIPGRGQASGTLNGA